MHFDRHLVGWGVLLILLGLVPLAVNEGYLDAGLVSRWPELWPILVMAIGLSLILSRSPAAWLGSLAVAVVVGVMGGGLLATGAGDLSSVVGCGSGTAQPFESQAGAFGPSATVDLQFDCGRLTVATTAGSGWQLSGNDGDGDVPMVTATEDGLSIRPRNDPGAFFQRGQVDWTLDLPQAPSLDLGVTLNAGDGDIQLAGANLASLNVTVNAGSLSGTLGSTPPANAVNVTVNAGSATIGTAATAGEWNLSLNAGSLDVCVPEGAPLRVRWTGTLASNDLDGLDLVKVDDQTWTTSSFTAAAPHLELDVNANAGSFGLSLGGSCSGS